LTLPYFDCNNFVEKLILLYHPFLTNVISQFRHCLFSWMISVMSKRPLVFSKMSSPLPGLIFQPLSATMCRLCVMQVLKLVG